MGLYELPTELPPMERKCDPLTLDSLIKAISKGTTQAIFPVTGDCLEAVGVEDNGWVAVDFTRFPAPPKHISRNEERNSHLCLCLAAFPGYDTPAVMLKEYCGVWGPWQMVGTRYDISKGLHRMNCCFRAEHIFGVVFAAWGRDGALKWEIDPEECPVHLCADSTIHGVNISEPSREDRDGVGPGLGTEREGRE